MPPYELTQSEYSFALGAMTMAFTLFMSGFFDTVRWGVELWLEHRKHKKQGKEDVNETVQRY